MLTPTRKALLLVFPVVGILLFFFELSKTATAAPADESAAQQQALNSLAALEPIDTHAHVMSKGDPEFLAMLHHLHMHMLDILLVDDHREYRKDLETQREDGLALLREGRGHVALCTTFDPFKFNDADFASEAIKGLNRDFVDGAIAVKIWKNIGMELKDKNGKYVFADDPKFEPIYQDIQRHNRTLVAHQAEPDAAWQGPNPDALDYSYYKENPTWYMYNKPGVPSKKEILDARDRMVAKNPKLRVVGAHLGSRKKTWKDWASGSTNTRTSPWTGLRGSFT